MDNSFFRISSYLIFTLFFFRGYFYFKYLVNEENIEFNNFFHFMTSQENKYGFYLTLPFFKNKMKNTKQYKILFGMNIIYIVLWLNILVYTILNISIFK
ncbi:MAG: hypothetical protein DRJ05_05870 [Bacteroidetes bacterium]|nr:MAG: hypothetical protein DRJ05_05870 [Bacteroidota bacterium]